LTQTVQHLLSKRKGLSSNPSMEMGGKKGKEKEKLPSLNALQLF
jgi:hypothetical protein